MSTVVVEKPAQTPDWHDLLKEAAHNPGRLGEAFRFFKQYSLLNKWLAATQLAAQGKPLQPISTFGTLKGEKKSGWLGMGRHVRKGEHASIALNKRISVKKHRERSDGSDEEYEFAIYRLTRQWFAMDQTDGDELVEEQSTEWELERALSVLEVTEGEWHFAGVGDASLGRADGRTLFVSPLDPFPTLGKIRQLAHISLGHTQDPLPKGVPEDARMREIEAETVTYLVGASLGLSGLEQSRAVMQSALSSSARIPDKLAQRAFSVADRILNSGM